MIRSNGVCLEGRGESTVRYEGAIKGGRLPSANQPFSSDRLDYVDVIVLLEKDLQLKSKNPLARCQTVFAERK
jgi:hypothetical protein